MLRKKAHHIKQFKSDAINQRKEHPDFTQIACAQNLETGVSKPSLDEKPIFEIRMVRFQLLVQAAMLQRKIMK